MYVCPISDNLYGDIYVAGNFSCVATCSNGNLRDNSTQRCTTVCPSNPSYWADLPNFKCVYKCPANRYASNRTDRLCVSSCASYLTFADRAAQICVNICP